MGKMEDIANNANKVMSSDSAVRTRKMLITLGKFGAMAFGFITMALIGVGIAAYLNETFPIVGIVFMILGGFTFIIFIAFLVVLIFGLCMAVGAAGAQILDTTHVCPYCNARLSSENKYCPSCGRVRTAD